MSYWICDKDQNCIDCPKHFPEETCEHWIEVELVKDIHTNADHIRAMTNEELAKLGAKGCPHSSARNMCAICGDGCYRCWLDWLNQEVKEAE